MKAGVLFSIALAVLPLTCSVANAGGGRFLSGLLARGAGAAVRAGASSGAGSPTKSYTSDVLTVSQLAGCIRTATKLDADSDGVEANRASLQALIARVDASSAAVEAQRASLNRSSKSSVNAFNTSVDRHNDLLQNARTEQSAFNATVDAHNHDVDGYNTDCAKKYYADDLTAAQKLAASN